MVKKVLNLIKILDLSYTSNIRMNLTSIELLFKIHF